LFSYEDIITGYFCQPSNVVAGAAIPIAAKKIDIHPMNVFNI